MIRRLGLAVALMICAAPALARAQACGRLGAVLDLDDRGFASLSWQMTPRRGIIVSAAGAPVGLPPAQECTLTSEAAGTSELSCQWEYAAQAGATAGFDALLARMRGCLGADSMRPGTIYAQSNPWRPVQRNVHEIERDGGAHTDMSLQLVEYIAQNAPGAPPASARYFVELTVTRDEE
jgi:hypothetical protein